MVSVDIGAIRSRLHRSGRSPTRKWSRVFTYHWDLPRLAAVTWNGFLFLELSHLCVLLPLVLFSDERELLVSSVFEVSTLRVAVLREGWKNFRDSKCFTLLAPEGLNWLSTVTGEPVSGKFILCRSQVCPFLMAVSLQKDLRPSRPTVSKRFTDGSQAAFLGLESKFAKGALNWICMS